MARAATSTDLAPAAAPKKGGLLPMLLIALIAAGGAAGGTFFFTQQKSGASAHAPAAGHGESSAHGAADAHAAASADGHAPAQYLPLTPSLVVNLEDEMNMRYLQADVELMSRDPATLEAVKLHMPRVRNALMMLFTQQKYEHIVTREGKQDLQTQALKEVQNVLQQETGKPGVEALYFTNFVMQ